MTDFFAQFKWLDIFIVILLFRICYVAIKNGLPVELFKLLGTLSAVYVSQHYYTYISFIIQNKLSLQKLPHRLLDFLVFLLLAFLGYMFFVILRSIFYRFIKMEAAEGLSKWGGLLLGLCRGGLLAGIICFTFTISNIDYLNKSVKNSSLGPRFFTVAPDTYEWLWNNLFSKFMPKEKINLEIYKIRENFLKR